MKQQVCVIHILPFRVPFTVVVKNFELSLLLIKLLVYFVLQFFLDNGLVERLRKRHVNSTSLTSGRLCRLSRSASLYLWRIQLHWIEVTMILSKYAHGQLLKEGGWGAYFQKVWENATSQHVVSLTTKLIYVSTIKEPHLPYKAGLDVTQSHPLRRTRFGQYQPSSVVLGWSGDGVILSCTCFCNNSIWCLL